MKIPIILALETATSACSVALLVGGACYSRFELTDKAHTQLLQPMIKSVLLEANLGKGSVTAIAVGQGPGSFTGVRIAVSAAQGLAFGLNIPVYPISTLSVLGMQARLERPEEPSIILSAIDARMHEVYASVYQDNQPEILCSPETLLKDVKDQHIIAIGSGWDVYFDKILANYPDITVDWLSQRSPHAQHVALLAARQIQEGLPGVSAVDLLPVYIRNQVAQKTIIT